MEYLKDDGVMCVSFMGVDDPWADTVFDGIRYYSITDIELDSFKKKVKMLWELEDPKYKNSGRNSVSKKWHLYKMILKKK